MIYKLYSKYTVYIICYLQQGVGARSFADREINKKFKLFIFCIYFHSLFTSSNMLYLYIVTEIGGDASLSFLYERHCAACALLNRKIIITLYFLYMSQKLLLIIIRKIDFFIVATLFRRQGLNIVCIFAHHCSSNTLSRCLCREAKVLSRARLVLTLTIIQRTIK